MILKTNFMQKCSTRSGLSVCAHGVPGTFAEGRCTREGRASFKRFDSYILVSKELRTGLRMYNSCKNHNIYKPL